MFRICQIKYREAAFHGQAVKTVAYLRVSTAQLGVSKTAIAKLTGVSRTTLYSFMSTRGLKPSPWRVFQHESGRCPNKGKLVP